MRTVVLVLSVCGLAACDAAAPIQPTSEALALRVDQRRYTVGADVRLELANRTDTTIQALTPFMCTVDLERLEAGVWVSDPLGHRCFVWFSTDVEAGQATSGAFPIHPVPGTYRFRLIEARVPAAGADLVSRPFVVTAR